MKQIKTEAAITETQTLLIKVLLRECLLMLLLRVACVKTLVMEVL